LEASVGCGTIPKTLAIDSKGYHSNVAGNVHYNFVDPTELEKYFHGGISSALIQIPTPTHEN
jgi:hypothetical protein